MSQPRSIKDRRRASATFSRASDRAKSLLNQSHLTPKREHLGIISMITANSNKFLDEVYKVGKDELLERTKQEVF